MARTTINRQFYLSPEANIILESYYALRRKQGRNMTYSQIVCKSLISLWEREQKKSGCDKLSTTSIPLPYTEKFNDFE